MYSIAIIGAKNSGKTTLVEQLLQNLTDKGLRCMSKKHTSHHHSFDTVGKDSERHRKAGAGLTIAVNPGEFAIFSESNDSLQNKIEKAINSEFDICLIEGDKFSDIDKILLTRNISEIETEKIQHVIASYGDDSSKLSDNHFERNSIDTLGLYIIAQSKKHPTAGEQK